VNSDWIAKNLYWLVPSLLVVIGGIARLIYWLFKSSPPNQPFQQTASPTITQNNSPTTNVIVHQPAAPSTIMAAPSMPSPSRRSMPVRPNLEFLKSKTVNIRLDAADVIHETERDSGDTAVLACFRNESREEGATAEARSVIANAIYRNSDGLEIEGITRLAWLNEPHDMVDFGVDDRHCVVLAVVDSRGRFFGAFRRRKQTPTGDQIESNAYDFNEPIATIELKLISHGDPLIRPLTFDCSLDDGIPRAVARNQSNPKSSDVRSTTAPEDNRPLIPTPQVVISCEWPPQTAQGEISGVRVVLNRPFTLRNLSDIPAANVQIQEISRQTGTVRFGAVSLLEKGKDVQLVPIIKTSHGTGVRDFENILQDETPSLLSVVAPEAFTIRLPMTVSYNDKQVRKRTRTGIRLVRTRWGSYSEDNPPSLVGAQQTFLDGKARAERIDSYLQAI
jgi:hypothetical protein